MSRLDDIQSGRATGPAATAARLLAGAAVPLYRAGLAAHQAAYRRGLKETVRLPRPVISVGNLTTGGTGKTPMVAWACRALLDAGKRPAVLTRGYKAERDSGESDEARELAERLGEDVPILAHPDRAAQGLALLDREPGIDAFVLDDGFQHYRLARDLDLVLIDATRPWGHGRLLPRGLLREPKAALRRADAVVLTRCELVDGETLDRLDAEVARFHGQPAAARVASIWSALRRGNETLPTPWLATRRVAGACGIGNPAAFEAMLRRHAAELVEFTPWPDHHQPSAEAIKRLVDRARRASAEAVVITRKDAVKPPWQDASGGALPVIYPVLETSFVEGEAVIRALIADASR